MTDPEWRLDRALRILLVEDNRGDIRLLEETLKEWTVPTTLSVVRDGLDALAYLRRTSDLPEAPPPDVIFLDLTLPRMDGRRVLAEVRSDPKLNVIPVVIYTGSRAEDDLKLAFNFRADGYLRKPLALGEFEALVRRLDLGVSTPVGAL